MSVITVVSVTSPIWISFVRAISGWAIKALKDDVIEEFEWKELIATLFEIGLPAVALALLGVSLTGLGLDVALLAGALTALLWNLGVHAIKAIVKALKE